jgi:hypothetical protein
VSTCTATRRDGHPCTVRALPGEEQRCFAHSARTAEKRRAAYATGGANKATARRLGKIMPASLRPVLHTLMTALDEVHSGELDPKQASAMAAVAGAIGRLYSVAEFEQRIEQLERSSPHVRQHR